MRAAQTPATAPPDSAHEDPLARQIAQNDRITQLLEQLNARSPSER